MRVSQVIQDIPTSIREHANALANRLHAEDNFAPDGEAGQVLTSRGKDIPPHWASGAAGAKGEKGDKGDTGATGATGAEGPMGPAGPGTEPAEDPEVWMPLFSVMGGVGTVVLDADDSLIPTLIPL